MRGLDWPYSCCVKLTDVVSVLRKRYPHEGAEPWDHVGLQVGDMEADIHTVMFTVDVTDVTVREALDLNADLIISHHPLFFGDIDSLDMGNAKARLAQQLIKNDCALYVAHTNADIPTPGVSDALAQVLGLTNVRPLSAQPSRDFGQLTYYVPAAQHQAVLDAVFDAGAGSYGNYDRAAFVADGVGQFRPLHGASPAIGELGSDTFVSEKRVELLVPMSKAPEIVQALLQAHPYEEVAYNLVVTEPRAATAGLGRVGQLTTAMTLEQFAQHVATALPATHHGVRVAGEKNTAVKTVAVCGGSGSDFLAAAHAAGADVYVSADFKHHQVQDHRAQTGMAIVDVAHWASEWPWLNQAADLLRADLLRADLLRTDLVSAGLGPSNSLALHVSSTPTDPWSGHLAGGLSWQ